MYFDAKLSMFGLAPSAMEVGGQRPLEWPEGPSGPKWPPSPLQELEGWARSAEIF